MNKLPRNSLFHYALLFAVVSCIPPLKADVPIVSGDKARAVVVIAAEPTPTVTYAAEELVRHVEKATGVELPVAREDDIPDQPEGRIYLGDTKAARAAGINPADLGPDTFRLKTDGDRLFIAGMESADADPLDFGRPRIPSSGTGYNPYGGPLFGVYEWLQRELGVRWLWPGELGTYVPQAEHIVVGETDRTVSPPFSMRRFRLGWKLQKQFSNPDGFDFERRVDSSVRTLAGGMTDDLREIYARDLWVHARRHRHGFSAPTPVPGHGNEGVTWRRYGDKHPEWFALNKEGERAGPHLCVSNRELARYIVEEKWDGGDRLSLGNPDETGYCLCEDCLAWDEGAEQAKKPGDKRYIVSYRYARFWKRIYNLAVERNPDVQVVVYNYYNNFPAPRKPIELNENIIGHFVPWGWRPHPSNQWLASITAVYSGGILGWKKGNQRQQWLGWRDTGMRLVYRPNAWHEGYVMPRHVTTQPPPFFKFAYEHGMIGFDYDSLFGYWVTRGPELYLHFRWSAHPDEAMDDVLGGYFEAFGSASGRVKASFDYWGDYQPPDHSGKARLHGGGISKPHLLFPPESFDPPLDMLRQGLEKAREADRPVYAERVEFLIAGLRHARLTSQFWSTLESENGPDRVPRDPEKLEITKEELRQLLEFRHEHRDKYIADFVHAAAREQGTIKGLSELCRTMTLTYR